MKPLVMFVDDDSMMLAAMRRQLVRAVTECDFAFCQGGLAALEEASKRKPAIVFSDMRMPEMDGPTFLAALKELCPSTVCYALTGQTDDGSLIRVASLVERVFTKPLDTLVLRDLLAQHFRTRDK